MQKKFRLGSGAMCAMAVLLGLSAQARTFEFKQFKSTGSKANSEYYWMGTEKSKSAWFRVKIGGATKIDDTSEMEIRAATVFKNVKDRKTGVNDIAKFRFDPINKGKAIYFMISSGVALSLERDKYWYGNDGKADRGWQLAGCIIEIWQKGKVVKHWSGAGTAGKTRLADGIPLLRINKDGYASEGDRNRFGRDFDNATEIFSVDEKGERVDIDDVLQPYRESEDDSEAESEKKSAKKDDSADDAPAKNVVAQKLRQCDFLLNEKFKKKAKFYLCLFSASWCPPCRAEMPRIAETYADTLKNDPDIELIHFSRDRDEEKAMSWAKEHNVKFPVVKPQGGNPLDLHTRGIPHLFIVKADGTLVEEGHPMRIFNEEKFREIKGGSPATAAKAQVGDGNAAATRQCAGKLPSQFMPTKGLLASFDYDDGKETNAGYGEVRRENDHVSFVEGAADYDGVYKYSSRGGRFKQGDRFEEDYVVPSLNFDRFTVACSFRPTHTNNWGQYFFRIGQTCYSILEVSLSRGKVSVYGRKLRNLSVPYMDREWNWMAVSVDVAKREAWLSVNGCEPVSTSLSEDFFWFIPSDRVKGDKFRRLTFGNWQCGERYCGQVDDLMVYDRALGREEFAKVCKRTDKAKDRAVASFEKPAPAKLPELRDDRWLFMPHDEQSVYWNGTIGTRGVSLKVRREADGLCVEPPGGIADSVLDLTLPVADASGRPLSIVGVGSGCDPYCIRARKALLSEVRLPDTLKTIRKNAFAGCMKLESIVIPENVREIGTFAFTDCGHLTKLEIRSKSVAIAKDAFSGSTPVGTDMPQKDWTTGPLTKEIKGDPKFEYAKEGRMAEPLFSFSYGDIQFGRKYGDVGGWGSTRMKGHEDWGRFDLNFIKLGTDQLAGVTLKWGKKEESEGVVDAAKTVAKELVALIEEKVKGKIDAPLYLPESEWPEYGSKGNHYADYSKLKPIGSSKAEANGYTVKVDVYGGTKDVNVAVVITIIDNYMFKAWGMSPKICH